MSAKEVVQVSAIVQKLEKERHLKRVLASNAATGTGAVASSESLSSAKSQSTSLDHVAANPSTSTTTSITETESALAAAIRRAAEERKKKAALDLSPPPLPEKMPSTPPTPITPITPATPMAVTSAPGGETHLFKKVAGKWVETGPATALFETTGNGAGVTLSDSDSATPQPNPPAQRQSMHSKTPQQRPSLTSHASPSQTHTQQPTTSKRTSAQSTSPQPALPTQKSNQNALQKLDEMLSSIDQDLKQSTFSDPSPASKTATPSTPKKTVATRKKNQSATATDVQQQPPIYYNPYTKTTSTQPPIPSTANPQPISLSSLEKLNALLGSQGSLTQPFTPLSGTPAASRSEDSVSSSELPPSVFKAGSSTDPLATLDAVCSLPQNRVGDPHLHHLPGAEIHGYEDAGGMAERRPGDVDEARRKTLEMKERLFEADELPPPKMPYIAEPVVISPVSASGASNSSAGTSSSTAGAGTHLGATEGSPATKRIGVRSARTPGQPGRDDLNSIISGSTASSNGGSVVSATRQPRVSSLRGSVSAQGGVSQRASMLTSLVPSATPAAMPSGLSASGALGSGVIVDEAGMDTTVVINAVADHSKGFNEQGYPMREPILEKTGKISNISYNFFISRASLYCATLKDGSIHPQFPIPLHNILHVSWENKRVTVTWYYSKPPPKREPRTTDIELEFSDLFNTSQWAIKLLAAAFKNNHTNEVLGKQAIFFVDQEDVKLVREVLKDLIIPILEAARKPFDVQLIDAEGLKNALDRLELGHINSITYLRTKNTSTKTFKLVDECLMAAALRARGRDMKQIKVLQPEMDPVEVALAALKEPTQSSQFCIMNTILKYEKGRFVKSKQKSRK